MQDGSYEHAENRKMCLTTNVMRNFLLWCFRNAGLQVDSGELRVISSVVLEAEDLDTPPEQVYYFLNVAPRFGKLQLKVCVCVFVHACVCLLSFTSIISKDFSLSCFQVKSLKRRGEGKKEELKEEREGKRKEQGRMRGVEEERKD